MKVNKLVDFSDIYIHKEIYILSFDIDYVKLLTIEEHYSIDLTQYKESKQAGWFWWYL